MRKLFMFLAVAVLTIFGLSCGGDDKPEEVKLLVLTADATSVDVGTEVLFTVTDGKNIISDATIVGTNGAKVTKGKFQATKAGDYSFTANKNGFKNSKEVVVKVIGAVDPNPSTQDNNELKLSQVTLPEDVKAGSVFVMSVLDENDKPVEGAVLHDDGKAVTYLVSDDKGLITIVDAPSAIFKFTVVKDGVTSNILDVLIPRLKGKGTFNYNNVSYNIVENIVSYLGIDKLTAEGTEFFSFWEVTSYDDSKGFASLIVFTTPADLKDGKYVPQPPNGTNEVGLRVQIYELADKEYVLRAQTADGDNISVNLLLNGGLKGGMFFDSDYEGFTSSLSGSTFSVEFTGYSTFFDRSKQKLSPRAKFPDLNINNIKRDFSRTDFFN